MLFRSQPIERTIESGVEQGESNSVLALAPAVMRDVLDRVERAVGPLETPTVAITTSGSRYFLRLAMEASMPNLIFLSHNEVPAGVKVISLGVIQ